MIRFILTSILLGVGLTMDAFSVSIANGLKESNMRKIKMFFVAFTYAFFQFLMPLIGWICVHTIVTKFKIFEYFIPWIALILLLFIGGKMIFENIKKESGEEVDNDYKKIGIGLLIIQGIATSIDALSVGFTIADYNFLSSLLCCLIIAFITLSFCIFGLIFGKKLGNKFSKRAELIGGIILVLIGLEIFISGMINLYA